MAEEITGVRETDLNPGHSGIWLHNAVNGGLRLTDFYFKDLEVDEDGRTPYTLGGPEESVFVLSNRSPGRNLERDEELLGKMPRDIRDRFHEYKHRQSKLTTVTINDGDEKYSGIGGYFAQGKRAVLFMGTLADPKGRLFYFYNPYNGPPLESESDVKNLDLRKDDFRGFTKVPVPNGDLQGIEIMIDDLRESLDTEE